MKASVGRALGWLGSGLPRATLVYALVTLVAFRDLVPNAGTHLFSDLGDPLLNASILAWNARHLPLTAEWWNFPSFALLDGVTAFTEHLLLTYPVATPVIWLTGNPILAYNILFLAAAPLNGAAAFALAREVTGSNAGALIAGFAYAFAPYQAVHLSHLQLMMSFGMPFALLWLHRYFRTGRWTALVGFGAGWLMTTLANSALLFFFPLLVLLWSVWFVRPREWKRLVGPVVAAIVATLPLLPLLWGYHERQSAYGFSRNYTEIRLFSADIVGLFGMYHRAVPWRGVLPHDFEEGALFPGFATLALAIVAVHATSRGAAVGVWPRRLIRGFALLTLIVLARVWAGPFGWHLGPLPLPPFTPFRLFTLAASMLLAAALVTQTFRRAWRERSVVMFYAVAVVVMWLIALGPQPEWSTPWRGLAYGPYYLLIRLPGMQSIRVPARAWLPAVLCLSVLTAFGTAVLLQRFRHHARILVVALALLVVAEGWFVDRIVPAPQPMRPGAIPEGAVVLDLPVEEGMHNAIPQYRGIVGKYRTVNGYSGYLPPHFTPLRRAIADLSTGEIDAYRRLADLYVVVREGVPAPMVRWIAEQSGAEHLFDIEAGKVYRLPQLR